MNAKREILSRFVRFCDSNMIAAYCGDIGFLAFSASTTMSLAHIEVCRKYEIRVSNYATVFHFLVHQRLAGRGLMKCTLQSMKKMTQIENDALACNIASFLLCLLAIEGATANDRCYNSRPFSEHGEE